MATATINGTDASVTKTASEDTTPAIGHNFNGTICANCGTHLGDVNGNGKINIVDAQRSLLITLMSINSKLQNDSFPEKKVDKYDANDELVGRGYSTGSHSENKVANEYENWNAQAILQRGMQLLAFMEERWDIKFQNENAKRKLLYIDFVTDSNEAECE